VIVSWIEQNNIYPSKKKRVCNDGNIPWCQVIFEPELCYEKFTSSNNLNWDFNAIVKAFDFVSNRSRLRAGLYEESSLLRSTKCTQPQLKSKLIPIEISRTSRFRLRMISVRQSDEVPSRISGWADKLKFIVYLTISVYIITPRITKMS